MNCIYTVLLSDDLRDRINKTVSYYHLIAWILPFVFTITIWAMSEVDGNSMTGICFVGFRNPAVRIGLVICPFGCIIAMSLFFFLAGILRLNAVMRDKLLNNKDRMKLQSIRKNTITRCGLTFFFISVGFMLQFNEYQHASIWSQSLNDMILYVIG